MCTDAGVGGLLVFVRLIRRASLRGVVFGMEYVMSIGWGVVFVAFENFFPGTVAVARA